MASLANLDALIPREDFEISPENNVVQRLVDTISIKSLEATDFFYFTLRKPDFQRETSDWTPQKICDFVQSFLDGDLIPAIILWNSGNNNFVIDGAHRLSALISWVNDDYGDKKLSRSFFEDRIPDEQIEIAEATRALIRKTTGTYDEHRLAITNPEKVKPEILIRAKRLGSLALQLQWVKGDSSKAEASFFKINQQAAPIDNTELKLLKARRSPNAMAARAIIRSGTGHKYWSKFPSDVQLEIQETAKAINSSLFIPKLTTPIKTLDLPIAGRGYSALTLPLIFDLVNVVNGIKPKDSSPPRDTDGTETLRFLKNTNKIINRISGTHPSCLGLHPAVYFYSNTGRYQPTAFLAIVSLLMEFEKDDRYKSFTRVRAHFEEFLLRHKVFTNQLTLKYGSGIKGYIYLKNLFLRIIDALLLETPNAQIVSDLIASPNFSFLQPDEIPHQTTSPDFNTDGKSATFLRDAIGAALTCKICNSRMHVKSMTVDHIVRKQDGGLGEVPNGQLTHPYCNTTIKN